jgi:hypothetical protein
MIWAHQLIHEATLIVCGRFAGNVVGLLERVDGWIDQGIWMLSQCRFGYNSYDHLIIHVNNFNAFVANVIAGG